MEALLPSEISRLVLGFIEDQNCTEAAKLFLETCPHLKECAAAAQSGRKFGTQVYGKNLVNILDEYTLIHSIVQERIQELPENMVSQLKSSCGTFLPDQVKHLLNGKPSGQRFQVNITVPSKVAVPQSSITCLTPTSSQQRSKSRIMGSSSASTRSRRTSHLVQEKRLTLRSEDTLEDVTASVTVQRIEATQLESLSGTTDRGSSMRDDEDEEENDSLLDPKTGEIISDKSHSVNKSCEVPKSVETGVTQSTNDQNKESQCSDLTMKSGGEEHIFGRTSTGRSSLDRLVSDIFSCHVAEEDRPKEVMHPPDTSRTEVVNQNCDVGSMQPPSKDLPTPSNISGTHSSQLHQSPSEKETNKSVHESYLYTPKRSGAKRKAKPTPLKMITPLKSKAAPETLDPSEVVVDPKCFIGSLLDNRQLHEKIAENINQLIWSCGSETEVAEVPAQQAPSAPPSASGETVMHQELEKAIKTVVDKTEADPLFERLLNEILGPECEDDNSMLGDKSELDMSLGAKTPEGRNDISQMTLEDQNEEAINSILKAQPVQENPKPSEGSSKDQVHPVKIVRGRPSGACKSIFSDKTGGAQGRNVSGTNLPAGHADKDQTQVNKLVLVPIVDVIGPPLSFPRVNINGVEQYIVPVDSLNSIPMYRPIAPAGTNNTSALGTQYILRKATTEDLKNLDCRPSVVTMPVNSTDLTPIAPSLKPLFFHLQLQDPNSFATSTPSSSAALAQVSNSVNENVNSTMLSKTTEGQSVANINENESEANKTSKGPASKKESTPTVFNPRPERAVTEGRLPILEPPKATPLMTAGGRRASLSTPRRSRSSGHVRALDFGSTPPSVKKTIQDSQLTVSSLSQVEPNHVTQSTVSKPIRKDFQKVLDTPDNVLDPSTCIATRSPPPRLSKAWNKVGVDLIFGSTSPNESFPATPSSGKEVESEANETDARINMKNNETDARINMKNSDDTCRWESPKLRLKGTWDADLRAIVSSAEVKPKLTKKQQREKERKEKAQKRAEEALKKKNAKLENSKKEGTKGLTKKKGKSKAEQDSVVLKDKNSVEEKSTEEITNEDTKEEDNSVRKRNLKRRSKGEPPQKKKPAPKKSVEKITPAVDTNVSQVSPEKNWVVQQSPGSLATKRSIHEITQPVVEIEPLRWPGSARKHLDLQETPKKSEISIEKMRRTIYERTTLTVVETPLFPMTPNINLINTPNDKDSSDFVEEFPSYYKPSALEVAEKEPVSAETEVSKSGQELEVIEDISETGGTITDNSKVNTSNIENQVDAEVSINNPKKKVKGKASAKKKRQSCKAKKPVARKTGKQNQSKSKNDQLSDKKEEAVGNGEENEVPERRVLRPRKNKTSYVEEPLDDEKKRKGKEESDEDYPLSELQRKNSKCDTIDFGSSPEPLSKDLPNALISVPSEDQTQEPEVLAQSISLKLSPLCPKIAPQEEEDTDEESMSNDGPFIRRTPVSKPLLQTSSSSSSSDSSSSSSYSSDISSDEDSRREMNHNSCEKSLNDNSKQVSCPPDEVNNSTVMKTPNSQPKKSLFSPVDDIPACKSFNESEKLVDEVDVSLERTVGNEIVENTNLINPQNDINLETVSIAEKVSCHNETVGSEEHEKENSNLRIEGEKSALESNKDEESISKDGQEKGKNSSVPEIKESNVIEKSKSDDVKMRKDNLDKVLCLNKNQQESSQKEGGLGIECNSTSIMNLSFAELSMLNELEQKRRRTINKLKGTDKIEVKGRKRPFGQVQNSPSKLQGETLRIEEKKNSPKTQTNSDNKTNHQCNQKGNESIMEEDDEDCPTLRLSEGEDGLSPSKRIVPSPRSYELLDTIEERLALIHADYTSTAVKKTARMSCSPQKKELLLNPLKNVPPKVVSGVFSKKEGNFLDGNSVKSTVLVKKNTVMMDMEPIPSTSKASERMHRAAERKLSKQNAMSESSSRSCHMTFRKRNNINPTDCKKSKPAHTAPEISSSNQILTDSIEDKEIQESTQPLELSKTPPAINRTIVHVESSSSVQKKSDLQKGTEDEERSKKDSKKRKKPNVSGSIIDPNTPKVNKKLNLSTASKVNDSAPLTLPKVSAEGNASNQNTRFCSDKPDSDSTKEIIIPAKDTPTSNGKETETKNKKNSRIVKNVKCSIKNSLFEEEEERRKDRSEEISLRTLSHSQLGNFHSVASKHNEIDLNKETTDKSKNVDCSSVKNQQNSKSSGKNESMREPVKLNKESGVVKLSNEKKSTKMSSEIRKDEDNSFSRKSKSKDKLETSPTLDKGSHSMHDIQNIESNCDENVVCTSSSSDKNSHHLSESKKSEVGDSFRNSDTCDKSKLSMQFREENISDSENERDGLTCNLQNDTNVISENSSLDISKSASDCSSEKESFTNNIEQCNSIDLNVSNPDGVSPNVTEISFELDEGVVRLTMSPYVELLSYVNHQKVSGIRKSAGGEERTKVAPSDGVTLGDRTSRKRKHSSVCVSEVETSKDSVSKKGAISVKGSNENELNIRRRSSDDSQIKKVLETLNNPSSGPGSVDDDSLLTYTVLGCVDSEEMQSKEDEESERVLPLKKRRTTTEETPVKFQQDSVDGSHGNTGIISQLKTMEIEDFLSKVHGDGS